MSAMTQNPQSQTPLIHPRLALALAGTFIVQTAAALLWAGASGERLAQLERRADASSQLIERTARLEEQVYYMRATLERIEQKIDQGGD